MDILRGFWGEGCETGLWKYLHRLEFLPSAACVKFVSYTILQLYTHGHHILFHDDYQLFGCLKHIVQFRYPRRWRTQWQQSDFVVDIGTAVLTESCAVGKLGGEHFSRFDRSASSDRSELAPKKVKKKKNFVNIVILVAVTRYDFFFPDIRYSPSIFHAIREIENASFFLFFSYYRVIIGVSSPKILSQMSVLIKPRYTMCRHGGVKMIFERSDDQKERLAIISYAPPPYNCLAIFIIIHSSRLSFRYWLIYHQTEE